MSIWKKKKSLILDTLWQCLSLSFGKRWEMNIVGGSSNCKKFPNQVAIFLHIYKWISFPIWNFALIEEMGSSDSSWTSWASLSFLRLTKHIFCHFKQTDNCTAPFSGKLKKSWIGIFLDSKLHMYASKYNVHSGQKSCHMRKIVKSMTILFLPLLLSKAIN